MAWHSFYRRFKNKQKTKELNSFLKQRNKNLKENMEAFEKQLKGDDDE